MKILSDRAEKVLQIIIHHYIKTASPVSSKMIVRDYGFGYSSATVRNIMSELERLGYLNQPHTSAGRIPTDKGYRFYVDSIMEVQRLSLEEKRRIEEEYTRRSKEMEDIFQHTSKLLSLVSHYAGFAIPPNLKNHTLRFFRLVHLGGRKTLMVLIFHFGVKHRIIEFSTPVTRRELEQLSSFLESNLRGKTLTEDTEKEMLSLEFPEAMKGLIQEVFRAISQFQSEDLYLDGSSNVFAEPEFANYKKTRQLFEVLERKRILWKLLNRNIKGINVLIGEENPFPELSECSLVTTTCQIDKKSVGALGIIGPKRMEYSRMVSLVGYISDIIHRIFWEKKWKKRKQEII